MTEFVVFSDLHSHNFSFGAEQVPYFEEGRSAINSRLHQTLQVLSEIRRYCHEHSIDKVVFNGDLFHCRSHVDVDVSTLTYDAIRCFSEDGIEVHMIPGNHDMSDREGLVHSLSPFQDIDKVSVHDLPVSVTSLGAKCTLILVPFTQLLEDAKKRLEEAGEVGRLAREDGNAVVLSAHLGMQGAKVGSDYVLVSDNDVGVSDVPQDSFDLCLFGHYHQHQKLFRNGWYVGATHHHNWSDANTRRGFLHVQVEPGNYEFKFVETTEAARFHVLREGDSFDVVRPGDFVRVHTDSPASTEEKNRLKDETKASYLDLIQDVELPKVDIKLDTSCLDPQSMIDSWVDGQSSDLDKARLKEIGKKYLSAAAMQTD